MSQTHIWWIRRDIRLHDNQALEAALEDVDHLLPLFIIDPLLMDEAAPKRRAFLLLALSDLYRQLQMLRGPACPSPRPCFDGFCKARC
jgi:deoxyribodipyrimidine photo-lyase